MMESSQTSGLWEGPRLPTGHMNEYLLTTR